MTSANATIRALDGGIDPLASRIVAAFTDLVLVVDRKGTIAEVSAGPALEAHPGWSKLAGQPWVDVMTPESRGKVEPLLHEALAGNTSRSREINLEVEGLGEIPFRFTGAMLSDDRILVLGVDLRSVAQLQQRMVSAQQAMELEYERVRQSEAQYRVLFHVCREGVLIAQGPRHAVVEANPAAASLLGTTPAAIQGRPLPELFDPSSQEILSALLVSVKSRSPAEAHLLPRRQTSEVCASATMFRQSGSVVLLLRFWPADDVAAPSERDARVLEVLEAMPDAFVVTGEDLRILGANPSFCELVQQASEAQVTGESLERWLGRPGVDLNIIVSNLREHGQVRSFSTIVRGDFGLEQEATVAAVSAPYGQHPCFGFTIRPSASRALGRSGSAFSPRSAEQLQELVGRVSLKEIVQETSDLIERLCIEVALDISSNNRAAAAQLLGLSRQSLYTKLRRYGLEEFQPS
ncbi:MAG: transcriptional regulator PpsR [Myxococcota bacterium]